jgi:hypothetical protein
MKRFDNSILTAAWAAAIITGFFAFGGKVFGAEAAVIFAGMHRIAVGAAFALTIAQTVLYFVRKITTTQFAARGLYEK